MKICILCSLSKEEECKKATKIFQQLGHDVFNPFMFQESTSLYLVQKKYLELISLSDVVLVIPKHFIHSNLEQKHRITEDYSTMDFVVGESVSYEIAYARHIGKPVIFGMLPFIEEKEEKKHVGGNDEEICEGRLFWESMETKSV